MRMKRSAGQLMLIAVTLLAVACSPGETSFQREAERTIDDDNGDKLGVDVSDADCETPASTEPGTTFACTAVDGTGATYSFMTKITGSNKFEIIPQ
jgi:hypothetical protein